jgi:uncharacterized membrane protein
MLQRFFGLYLTKRGVEEMHLWPTIVIIFWGIVLVMKYIKGESVSVILLIGSAIVLYLMAASMFMPKTP